MFASSASLVTVVRLANILSQVLLYDFFADSIASLKDWGALLKYASGSLEDPPTLDLSDLGHAALRSELKCLYVGLTRARMRVWIWDASGNGDAFQASGLSYTHELGPGLTDLIGFDGRVWARCGTRPKRSSPSFRWWVTCRLGCVS